MILQIILSQILSSNFHIRTFVEATLIKFNLMINQPYSLVKTGLNDPKFVENEKTKATIQQIKSIVQTSMEE